ncbi:MAG TPA: tripartite tricarboxylate transporter substrate-binding protein [Burkholderiales bacterium]|nr:tripartite tricarboxylate transporter substrate-binding protein [Burkholderiales bacterium]
MPNEIVNKLHAETTRIMEIAEIRERLSSDGGEPGNLSQNQFSAFIRTDAARWAKVVKQSGATAE